MASRRKRRFEWDDAKRREVLRKHGIDLAEVPAVFDRAHAEDYDADHSQTEDRWRALGMLNEQVVVVSYTYRGRTIRLISARFATEDETELYYQEFFGEPL